MVPGTRGERKFTSQNVGESVFRHERKEGQIPTHCNPSLLYPCGPTKGFDSPPSIRYLLGPARAVEQCLLLRYPCGPTKGCDSPPSMCVCLLLQDLVQSCLRGGGGIWEECATMMMMSFIVLSV
jgi:hypothetical protein